MNIAQQREHKHLSYSSGHKNVLNVSYHILINTPTVTENSMPSHRTPKQNFIYRTIPHPHLHIAAKLPTSVLHKRQLPAIEPGARQQHRVIVVVLVVAAPLSHEVVEGQNGQEDWEEHAA